MTHNATIRAITDLTHDVRRFVVDKPAGFDFKPGQATEIALEYSGWRNEDRPFTMTSLPADPMLEFTIKCYPERDGVTDQMATLHCGDQLRIGDPWGAISYRGAGTFIAGGAGVTPFISILRQLARDGELAGNRLLFSNRNAADVIMHAELLRLLGPEATRFTLTGAGQAAEAGDGFLSGRIDEAFLERHVANWDAPIYLCGPPPMMKDIGQILERRGVKSDHLVLEKA